MHELYLEWHMQSDMQQVILREVENHGSQQYIHSKG